MTPEYLVVVNGSDALNYLDEITPSAERAAARAINRTTQRGRTRASQRIRDQVAFTASYLGPNGGRLTANAKARPGNLHGEIVARSRPTSLARFTKEGPLKPGQETRNRKKGVKVTVKPGVAKYLSNAFVIPLRAGQDGPLSNRGLAIRSETAPRGAYKPTQLGKNLWLLYAPSVAQVLYSVRNQGGVAEDIAPELEDFLRDETIRQLNLDLK